MPTGVPTPVVTVTTPCIHRHRANSADISMRSDFALLADSGRDYIPVGLFVLFLSSVRWPLRAACTFMTVLVPRDCRPKGRSPSFARVPVPYSSAEGNDPGGRQAVYYIRVVSCRCTCSRITNTRVTGYRTLAALASDSPPRASVIASRVPRPGAPRPAETGRDRLRRAARPRAENPPAESCTRFAPPLFSFWQPQRAVKGRIARVAHRRRLRGLSPLTARFAAALPRASRSERSETGRHY